MSGQSDVKAEVGLLHRPRQGFKGVLVPALTPFKGDLSPDADALLAFCKWLLEQGAHGLAIFGTTSEANSLSLAERVGLLDRLVEGGIPGEMLMPGTGACSIPEAVELTRRALAAGAGGVLVLPPFYYKNVADDGVFAYYAEVIERVGDAALKLYLYHFPQMSSVPLSHALISRLVAAYGPTIAGLKDSSGTWESAEGFIKAFPSLAIFPSSEKFLLPGLAAGGAGCISATANYQVRNIRRLIDAPEGAARRELNEKVARLRGVFEKLPLVPALKAAMARRFGRESWRTVRPPLVELGEAQRRELASALDAVGE